MEQQRSCSATANRPHASRGDPGYRRRTTLVVVEDWPAPSRSQPAFPGNPTPAGMTPFEVYRDELAAVTAIVVEHPLIAPAFAFRFDTVDGSVTISGDTTATDNLVRLATGTDLLLHEAIDFDWVEAVYGGGQTDTERASIDHHRKSHTSPE